MAEVAFSVAPAAGDEAGGRRACVRRRAERRVAVPPPKPVALQGVALVVLLGVTAALVYLLIQEPAPVAAAFLGAGLLMSVFCLLVWGSAVLGLGIGPAQLLALVRTVVGAIGDASAKDDVKTGDG